MNNENLQSSVTAARFARMSLSHITSASSIALSFAWVSLVTFELSDADNHFWLLLKMSETVDLPIVTLNS